MPKSTITLGYAVCRGNPPPTAEELERVDELVLALPPNAVTEQPGYSPLASIGDIRLLIAPASAASSTSLLWSQPVIAEKRGNDRLGYVGIDSRINTDAKWQPATVQLASQARPLKKAAKKPANKKQRRAIGLDWVLEWPRGPGFRLANLLAPDPAAEQRPIRVAIVDFDYAGWEALQPPARPDRITRYNPIKGNDPSAEHHGYKMAGVVATATVAPAIQLFSLPFVGSEDVVRYVRSLDIADQLATAVGKHQADVVIFARPNGAFGTPRALRAVLREAAITGRSGRGAAIFTAVGDWSTAGDRHTPCNALAADDLASQPWVFAVGAVDKQGRWWRDEEPLSLFGPSLDLCGLGALVGFPDDPDDTSQATALVACVAALALTRNPSLHLDELRTLLRMSADRVRSVDASGGQDAAILNGSDHAGHNFKLGHGRANALQAALAAADPVCYALLATREHFDRLDLRDKRPPNWDRKRLAVRLAWAWEQTCRRNAHTRLGELFLRARTNLTRLLIRSQLLQDALFWLARHLREIFATKAHPWLTDQEIDGVKISDHGALVDRIDYVLEALTRELSNHAIEAKAEIEQLIHAVRQLLANADSHQVKNFVRDALQPLDGGDAP